MSLNGIPTVAPDGTRAFDCNQVLTAAQAKAFHDAGYRAALRYVPRVTPRDYDLTRAEAEVILAAGLALGVVQHVAPENWKPTGELGQQYGAVAAEQCELIGLPMGVNVWCDLEGVKVGTPDVDILAFLHEWWTAVAAKGYLPGLYVGWHAGLSAQQLYHDTKFQYFWAAYNLNADDVPAVRGICMRQREQQTMVGVTFDPDIIVADSLNNQATFLAPSDRWPE